MNKVIVIGNLTRDPELTTTTGGFSLCKMTLAVSRKFASSNGERETDFINVAVWRNLADNCHRYLKKGSKCAVVGSMQTRVYDGQDGQKKYFTEVVADEVEFLSTRSENQNQNNSFENQEIKTSNKSENDSELEPIDDDELPF